MAVGNIKINNTILDNYKQVNFETYADGVGKPINSNYISKQIDFKKQASPLVKDALNYSNAALDKLTEQAKRNALIQGIEKGFSVAERAIGAVVTGIKDIVSSILKTGFNTVKSLIKKLTDVIKNSAVYKFIKKGLKLVLGVLAIPFVLLDRIADKTSEYIVRGLSALGLKNKTKTAFNKHYESKFVSYLENSISKSCLLGIFSEVDASDDGLYNVAVKYINSSENKNDGYSNVMSALKYLVNTGSKTDQEYYDVINRLIKNNELRLGSYPEGGYSEEDDELYVKHSLIAPNYKYLNSNLEIIDETRGWMNYDEDFISYISDEELMEFCKNPKIKAMFPGNSVSGKDFKEAFEKDNRNSLSKYDKMLIFSEYKKSGYYATHVAEGKYDGKKVKFEGFTHTSEIPKKSVSYKFFKKDKITSL